MSALGDTFRVTQGIRRWCKGSAKMLQGGMKRDVNLAGVKLLKKVQLCNTAGWCWASSSTPRLLNPSAQHPELSYPACTITCLIPTSITLHKNCPFLPVLAQHRCSDCFLLPSLVQKHDEHHWRAHKLFKGVYPVFATPWS